MGLLMCKCVNCIEFERSQPQFQPLQDWNDNHNVTFKATTAYAYAHRTPPLMVGLFLINEAASKGAVCLDGSLPGYHIHRGYGSGANSWLNPLLLNYSAARQHDSEINNSTRLGYANQALLSGCSAGGLASILHCDEFQHLLPKTTRVKCLSDAGFFLDVLDISGWRTLRDMFAGVVILQGMQKNLPQACTKSFNPIMCFFPQRLIASIRTPLFLVSTAYDKWQVQVSLAPASADHHGYWNECRKNYARCTGSQIGFLQGFRNQMLNAVRGFSRLKKNGLFINSCFAHCQTERQDAWFSPGSPHIGSKGIAKCVGNWYFDRAVVMAIDCPYPCDQTCHHLVFK